LAAADGVMRYLREQQIGYGMGPGAVPVPIVPAAVIYDRGAVSGSAPDAAAGYAACQDAARAGAGAALSAGRVGAGAGATIGKGAGPDRSSPGGLGVAAVRVGGLVVGALMVVNAVGEVRDPTTGQIVAGVRAAEGAGFVPSLDLLVAQAAAQAQQMGSLNTVIGVVATNAALDQAALAVVARMANAGLARAITPTHTMFDGDTLFALSLPPAADGAPSPGRPHPGLVSLVGALAAEAVSQAILNAIQA
jgi:L-aminopeptidase/D-esterase-like protein